MAESMKLMDLLMTLKMDTSEYETQLKHINNQTKQLMKDMSGPVGNLRKQELTEEYSAGVKRANQILKVRSQYKAINELAQQNNLSTAQLSNMFEKYNVTFSKLNGRYKIQNSLTKENLKGTKQLDGIIQNIGKKLKGFDFNKLSAGLGLGMAAGFMQGLIAPALRLMGVFDIIGLGLELLFLPFAEDMLDMALLFVDLVEKIPDWMKRIFGWATGIATVIAGVGSFITLLGLALPGITVTLMGFFKGIAALLGLGTAGTGLFVGFKALFSAFKSGDTEAVSKSIEEITDNVSSIDFKKVFSDLWGSLEGAWGWIEKKWETLMGFFGDIKGFFSKIFDSSQQTELGNRIDDAYKTYLAPYFGDSGILSNLIKGQLKLIGGFITADIPTMMSGVNNLFMAVDGAFTELLSWLGIDLDMELPNWVTSIVKAFADIPRLVWESWKTSWQNYFADPKWKEWTSKIGPQVNPQAVAGMQGVGGMVNSGNITVNVAKMSAEDILRLQKYTNMKQLGN